MDALKSAVAFYPVPAVPQEGLLGYLSRLCEHNALALNWLVGPSGAVQARRSETLDLASMEVLKELAEFTGLDASELFAMTVHRFAPALVGRDRLTREDEARMIIKQRPRVCPRCLQDGVLRLSWRLVFITACLQHDCLLVDRCSDGEHTFSGPKEAWVEFPCGEPTADVCVSLPSDSRCAQAHLHAVLGLDGYRDARGLLPELNTAQYMRTIATLQRQLRRLPKFHLPTKTHKPDVREADRELVAIHQILADWPRSFVTLLDDLRAAYPAIERAYVGMPRQFAALAKLGVPQLRDAYYDYIAERSPHRMARFVFPAEVVARRRYLTRTASMPVLGVNEETMQRLWGRTIPIEIREGIEVAERTVLEQLLKERKQWLTKSDTARRLGTEKTNVDRLIQAGVLRAEKRMVVGHKGLWIDASSVEGLFQRLKACTRRGRTGLPLREAVAIVSRIPMTLADIVQLILNDRLSASRANGPQFDLHELHVSRPGIMALLRQHARAHAEQAGLTRSAAADLLGVKLHQLERWIETGALRARPDGTIALSDALGFRRRYQPCSEVAKKLGVSEILLRKWVRTGLVKAVSGPAVDGLGRFWVSWKDVTIAKSFLTVGQIAQQLGVSKQRVRDMIAAGQLVPDHGGNGHHRYFRPANLDTLPNVMTGPDWISMESLEAEMGQPRNVIHWMLRKLGIELKRPNYAIRRRTAAALRRRISSAQAAKLLGASEIALRKWARTGQLVPCSGPSIDGRQYYRYTTHAVLAFQRTLEDLQARRGKLAPRSIWSVEEAARFLNAAPSVMVDLSNRGFIQMIDGGFKPGDVRRLAALPNLTGLVTSAEAAAMLKLDRSSLRTYASRMPEVLKFGNTSLYRESDVQAVATFRASTLTGPEAAGLLGVHRNVIRDLMLAGRLRPVSGPNIDGIGVYRYSRDDIDSVRVVHPHRRRTGNRLNQPMRTRITVAA